MKPGIKKASMTLGIALAAGSIGCAPLSRPVTERERTAAIGGVAGGAGGAIIGSMAGGAVVGGLFGLPLGALAGWYFGDQLERRDQVREARVEDRQAELARLRRENDRLKNEGTDRASAESAPQEARQRASEPMRETTLPEQNLPSREQPAEVRQQEKQTGGSQETQTAAFETEARSLPSSYERTMSPAKVREVQTKLNDLGYHTGQVDGVWGPRTEAAVRNFQQAKNIEATGRLDEQTLNALDIDRAVARDSRETQQRQR
jgi:hypothetical protein